MTKIKAFTSEELLALIEQARREGWAAFNLNDRGITALPTEIGRLARLQGLNLSNNRLTALPEGIGYLTGLQELYLSHNQLTALPPALGRLRDLVPARLWGNDRGFH